AEAPGHRVVVDRQRLHVHLVQRVPAVVRARLRAHQPGDHHVQQHAGGAAGAGDAPPEVGGAEAVPQAHRVAVPGGARHQEVRAAHVVEREVAVHHVVGAVD
ncbi:hypothetical protein RZS08_01695, partial [Arthrospira platensis SPKY1]|nr:hypothetical protein [Arthrospira platensis SPKY1]